MQSKRERVLVSVIFVLAAMLIFTNIDSLADMGGMVTGDKTPGELEETVRLDFFSMSMCPHCVDFEESLALVHDSLGERIDFNLFFVMARDENNIPQSPMGYEEVVENARQLCINEYYPERLFAYLSCIAQHQEAPGNAWKACAENSGIDSGVIEQCWNSEEGRELLWQNVIKAEHEGITRAPRLLVNGEIYSDKRSPNSIRDRVCQELSSHPAGCASDLESSGITGLVIWEGSEDYCYLYN